MAASFVPDPCSALAIQACLVAKKCLLDAAGEASPSALEATLGALDGVNVKLRATLDTHDICLREAITEALLAAGCVPPPLPPTPPVPDLSSCLAALEPLKAAAEDPLAFLSGIIEIEFDENGRPTKIKVP